MCGIFSKLTMKKLEERQCFLMPSFKWGCSGRYSCTWICVNIYLSIICFIWYRARYTMRRTRVPPNVTRSTKLRDAQLSPELAFRSVDFLVYQKTEFFQPWWSVEQRRNWLKTRGGALSRFFGTEINITMIIIFMS